MQFYSGKADWSVIQAVKRAVSLPVIGNGDIVDGESAARMLEETSCDGLMVARAAQGNPWIFAQIRAHLRGEPWNAPSVEERVRTALRHLDMQIALDGEEHAVREMRKHIAWYVSGLRGSARLREKINALPAHSRCAIACWNTRPRSECVGPLPGSAVRLRASRFLRAFC